MNKNASIYLVNSHHTLILCVSVDPLCCLGLTRKILVMSLNVSNVCRICLMSLANRKYFNLFVSSGRSQQLSAKIMACAWVQLMEGDGLPCHICCKCHDTLEVAYQFKQLCESSDVQLRQFFGRNKSNSLDLAQELRDCAADFKPINFNMSSERLELPPCELSLNTLRFLNQDMPFVQNLQLGLPDQPCDTKAEPGYHTAVHQPIQFSASLLERPLDQCSGFKSGSCVDGESFFSTIQAKLLEAVSETLSNAIPNELNDNRLVAWDLQNKQPLLPIPEKTLNELSSAIGQKIHEDDGKEDSLSFLEETRCILAPVKNICNSFENEPRLSKETEAGPSGNTSREGSPMPNISETDKFKGEEAAQGESKEPSNNKVREQCELCGKVFRYRGYVQLHMRTHTDERPHTCNICKQTFSMQHVLVTHMRTHSGDKPYICAECGKGFSQSSGLKLHMRSHSGDKPYQCEICSRKFAQSSNLKSHKLTHSGQRDHVCKICNRAFKFLKHLRSHQKTHYDHKEFKCPICTKSFIRKSYLETHISIHRGSKPFRCDACGQAFSSASNLRTHARIHSGLKPYTCQICKKNFTQSNTLKRHLKQHRLLGTPQLVPSS